MTVSKVSYWIYLNACGSANPDMSDRSLPNE
jgi:hypothetical protein